MLFKRPPPPLAPRSFVVGKFPGYSEFLRSEGELALAFETWLDDASGELRVRYGSSWTVLFTSTVRFLWYPPRRVRTAGALIGVIVPSVDAVGREYPLCVFAQFAAVKDASPHLVPLAFQHYLAEAESLARSAPELSKASLQDHAEALRLPSSEAFADADVEHRTFTEEVRHEDLWPVLFAGGEPTSMASHTLDALSNALLSLRGKERPQSDMLLRLPLSEGRYVPIWLDVVERFREPHAARASAFWTDETLLIAPGDDVLASVLSELFAADGENDLIDVTAVHLALEDPDRSLAKVLESIGSD